MNLRRPRCLPRPSLVAVALIAAAGSAFAADGPLQPVSVKAVARFDSGRATIHPQDRERILAEVGGMKDVSWQTVTAVGHADSVGSAASNERLSLRRAQAVKRYLVGKGLPPTLIEAEGAGETHPAASNDTAEGRAQNRRAEIEFKGVRTVAAR